MNWKPIPLMVLLATQATFSWGAEPSPTASPSDQKDPNATVTKINDPVPPPPPTPPAGPVNAASKDVRSFYQVLEDMLSDYEYDLKNGDVSGLRDIAIRNIALSENIPTSFKSHLELLITERTLKHGRARLIQCVPCRSKKATLEGESVIITAPDLNPAEMVRIARQNGVLSFMDIAFSYHPTGMLLSIYVVDVEGGNVIWSRTYNSETSRAAAARRGVDLTQVDVPRNLVEYKPTLQWRVGLSYGLMTDVSGYTGLIIPRFGAVERYDNRKKEVGFEISYMYNSAPAIEGVETIYSVANVTVLFIHYWNLIGELENFNKVRGSIFIGAGGVLIFPYGGGTVRGGYEFRMGKNWAVSMMGGYRLPSSALMPDSTYESISGLEVGAGVSVLF